jgi:hypothetical protein
VCVGSPASLNKSGKDFPTCHDFTPSKDNVDLVVGMQSGEGVCTHVVEAAAVCLMPVYRSRAAVGKDAAADVGTKGVGIGHIQHGRHAREQQMQCRGVGPKEQWDNVCCGVQQQRRHPFLQEGLPLAAQQCRPGPLTVAEAHGVGPSGAGTVIAQGPVTASAARIADPSTHLHIACLPAHVPACLPACLPARFRVAHQYPERASSNQLLLLLLLLLLLHAWHTVPSDPLHLNLLRSVVLSRCKAGAAGASQCADVPGGAQAAAVEADRSKFYLGSGGSSSGGSGKNAAPERVIAVGGGGVNDISFSPDGSKLAAVSRDGLLRVLEVATGQLLCGFHVSAHAWHSAARTAHPCRGCGRPWCSCERTEACGLGSQRGVFRE